MKTQISKASHGLAKYSEEYRQQALELWRKETRRGLVEYVAGTIVSRGIHRRFIVASLGWSMISVNERTNNESELGFAAAGGGGAAGRGPEN